ncbi:Pre-mRNA-splicing factor cwf19 [Mycoemilia scoparia]|uniref:Pre-mRNA-splicing factor cwf19 n=1 Tax=Mycoemilia scoparia TaxID=417184 RepID=A0A9W8A193_9FUNG|nr:Pre-mRNA-splicing factor cwf19 [Mycoemilia scoparia]
MAGSHSRGEESRHRHRSSRDREGRKHRDYSRSRSRSPRSRHRQREHSKRSSSREKRKSGEKRRHKRKEKKAKSSKKESRHESSSDEDDLDMWVEKEVPNNDDIVPKAKCLEKYKDYGSRSSSNNGDNDSEDQNLPEKVEAERLAIISSTIDEFSTNNQESPTITTNRKPKVDLNKLKSKAMKARMMNLPNADELEREYKEAVDEAERGQEDQLYNDKSSSNKSNEPKVIILPELDSSGVPIKLRAAASTGKRTIPKELEAINKRSINKAKDAEKNEESMDVRELARREMLSKGETEEADRAFAARIARDSKFEEDLDYLDDKAENLARKKKEKSAAQQRQKVIEDYKRLQMSVESCCSCFQHQEGQDGENILPPRLPIVALGARTYLGLPNYEPMCDGHCIISPIEHTVGSILNCDEDTITEIRNFMKTLYRLFAAKDQYPVFMETVTSTNPSRARHCVIECIPIPMEYYGDVPISFQQGLMSSDEEWSQHRKIIDTQVKVKTITKDLPGYVKDMTGSGKTSVESKEVSGGFLSTMTPKLPYFHVWFDPNGGMGHIIENTDLFPPWFGRQTLAGMLDLPPTLYRKPRILLESYKKRRERADEWIKQFNWTRYDWTKAIPS